MRSCSVVYEGSAEAEVDEGVSEPQPTGDRAEKGGSFEVTLS